MREITAVVLRNSHGEECAIAYSEGSKVLKSLVARVSVIEWREMLVL